MWIGCAGAMCGSLIFAGALFQHHVTGEVVVLALFLCAVPHAIGLGPLPWLMMSELYPNRVRAKAVSITTTVVWVVGFTAPFALPWLESISERLSHTIAGVFWTYSIVCLLALFWGWKWLPDTRGRTLEDIGASWQTK
jgi:SP family xylose:H+ symportor-like MFS transporter